MAKPKKPTKAKAVSGAELIRMERIRQVQQEVYTAAHDDAHAAGELAKAGSIYADTASMQLLAARSIPLSELRSSGLTMGWPWQDDQFKPSEKPLTNLIKAGALIAAEIDRLMRVGEEEANEGDPD